MVKNTKKLNKNVDDIFKKMSDSLTPVVLQISSSFYNSYNDYITKAYIEKELRSLSDGTEPTLNQFIIKIKKDYPNFLEYCLESSIKQNNIQLTKKLLNEGIKIKDYSCFYHLFSYKNSLPTLELIAKYDSDIYKKECLLISYAIQNSNIYLLEYLFDKKSFLKKETIIKEIAYFIFKKDVLNKLLTNKIEKNTLKTLTISLNELEKNDIEYIMKAYKKINIFNTKEYKLNFLYNKLLDLFLYNKLNCDTKIKDSSLNYKNKI